MPDRPQLPPPDRLIRELPTPDPSLGFYTELVARDSARFQALSPIPRGTPYAVGLGANQEIIDQFPAGLWFLKETVPIGSNTVAGMPQSDWVRWTWASDPDCEGVANATVEYLGDAVANPSFTRVFTVRRDVYDASPTLALGTAYTALIGIKVVAGGTGYKTTDTVNIAGSHGAEAVLVVDKNGTITHVVLKVEGSGYDSAALPAVTITTSTGSGASLTAIVQPKTAILTSQKKVELPDSDPRSHHYVGISRVYEVLPGPNLPYTRFDENLGPVQGYRQAVVYTNQAAVLTATGKTTYEAREGSSYVAWKIVEAWSDGTGGAGNPAYPLQTSTEFEKDGVKKVVTRQLKPNASIVTSETLVGGTLTRKFGERYNEFLQFQIIETITVIDADLLDLPSFTTSIPNLIPEIFRAQIPTHVESHIVEGAAEETVLLTGEFEHSERQLTPLYKEVRSTVLDDLGALPITITGMKETNQNKQVVTVAMKLCTEGTTPTVPTALIDVDFKKLGNGLAIEITKTIPSVFDAAVFQKQRDDSVPERFKKATPAITERRVATGTAAAPSLSSGDVSKSEQQRDAFVKETAVTNRAVGGYPTLEGQEYDQGLDVVIPYVESVDNAGTNIGSPQTEVTPLGTDIYGNDVELAKTVDTSALADALDAFMVEFPGTANVTFPDELVSIDAVWEKSQGDGDYSEDGFASATNSGWSMSPRGSGQASAAIIPSLAINTQRKWGQHLPSKHYLFYLPSPVTEADVLAKIGAVSSWPDFNPASHTIVCTGQRMSLRVDANVQRSEYDSGGSSFSEMHSEGTGASREVSGTVNTIHIPPTIHGSISVSELTTDTEDLEAIAHADTDGYAADRTETGTVTGTINPASLAATDGATTIPTGTFLLDTHCEPAGRLNYVRVHAETVDL